MIRSLEFHFFMPEREKFSYQRNRNWSTLLISPPKILPNTELTLMCFHQPVASFELTSCDAAAKVSKQHCQGINGNSVCKFLNYCRACKCSDGTDSYAGTSVCERIYRTQEIKLINSESCKMKSRRGIMIPATIERWGRRKKWALS